MKQMIKTVAFLLIGAILVGSVSQVMQAKYLTSYCKETYVTNGFYNLKKNSIDVCIIGNSQIVTGVSPMVMYEEFGISAYALGTGAASMLSSYYWLKECKRTQDINTVILDPSIVFSSKKGEEAAFWKSVDPMKWSWNKVQAVYDRSRQEGADSFATYMFPLSLYHDRWKELNEGDFVLSEEDSMVYRGNVMKPAVVSEDYDKFVIDNNELEDIDMVDYHQEYFEKFIEYCKENDLNLVLIKTPKRSWDLSKSEGVRKMAEKYDVPFLDFNYEELLKAADIDFTTDLENVYHLNLSGAEKIARYLGKYLKDNYDLKDRREEAYNPVDMERYHEDRDDIYLAMSQDINEYLDRLNNGRYCVMVQMTGDISEYWKEDFQEKFSALGFQTDISTLSGKNYVGILEQGTCIYEESSEKSLDYSGNHGDHLSYALESDIDKKKNDTKMIINNQEELFAAKGMNILVYDMEKDRIVDETAICKPEKGESLKLDHIYSFE